MIKFDFALQQIIYSSLRIDFGASRTVSDEKEKDYTKAVGTPIYMAPEVAEQFFKGELINFLTEVG